MGVLDRDDQRSAVCRIQDLDNHVSGTVRAVLRQNRVYLGRRRHVDLHHVAYQCHIRQQMWREGRDRTVQRCSHVHLRIAFNAQQRTQWSSEHPVGARRSVRLGVQRQHGNGRMQAENFLDQP